MANDVNETMDNEMTTTPCGADLLTESYEMTPDSKETPAWVVFMEGVATGIGTALAGTTCFWFLTKKGREKKRQDEIDRRVEEKLISLGIIPNDEDEEEKSEE